MPTRQDLPQSAPLLSRRRLRSSLGADALLEESVILSRRHLIAGIGTVALAGSALTGRQALAQETVDTAELHKPGALPDKVLGSEGAPVTIVEYASVTCPHCATFHQQTYPTLKSK